jgi:hypothetical protein
MLVTHNDRFQVPLTGQVVWQMGAVLDICRLCERWVACGGDPLNEQLPHHPHSGHVHVGGVGGLTSSGSGSNSPPPFDSFSTAPSPSSSSLTSSSSSFTLDPESSIARVELLTTVLSQLRTCANALGLSLSPATHFAPLPAPPSEPVPTFSLIHSTPPMSPVSSRPLLPAPVPGTPPAADTPFLPLAVTQSIMSYASSSGPLSPLLKPQSHLPPASPSPPPLTASLAITAPMTLTAPITPSITSISKYQAGKFALDADVYTEFDAIPLHPNAHSPIINGTTSHISGTGDSEIKSSVADNVIAIAERYLRAFKNYASRRDRLLSAFQSADSLSCLWLDLCTFTLRHISNVANERPRLLTRLRTSMATELYCRGEHQSALPLLLLDADRYKKDKWSQLYYATLTMIAFCHLRSHISHFAFL